MYQFNSLLPISEFAKISTISRKTLIYYDQIGLLSPEVIEENGYRYYTFRQLETVGTILALKQIGISLKEIKSYLDHRSPELITHLFQTQKDVIDAEIKRLQILSEQLSLNIQNIEIACSTPLEKIQIAYQEEEPIIKVEIPKNIDDTYLTDEFIAFCETELKRRFFLAPIGIIFSEQLVQEQNYDIPSYYYIRSPYPDDESQRFIKPAGNYLLLHLKCDEISGQLEQDVLTNISQQIDQYLHHHHLMTLGELYVNFLIDELCTPEEQLWVTQLSIKVLPKPCTSTT